MQGIIITVDRRLPQPRHPVQEGDIPVTRGYPFLRESPTPEAQCIALVPQLGAERRARFGGAPAM